MALVRAIAQPAALLALLVAAPAFGAEQGSTQTTAQPHYQLLWVNGKPVCPPGSTLVTQPKLMCVAAQPH